jgi:hypothetical protein
LSSLALAALAAAAGIGWVAALWYLRITAHPALLSWERLARLRGLAEQQPLGDRLGNRLAARLPLIRGLQGEADLGRLLAIAGESTTLSAWLLRTAGLSAATLAGLLVLDELTLLANGELALAPGICVAAGALVSVLAYVRLRRRARSRQQKLGQAVGDALPHLAVMTYHHRVPVSEALIIFARCQRDRSLHQLLVDASWEDVPVAAAETGSLHPAEPGRHESTAFIYERMGQALGVPMFAALGSAVRRVSERGLSSQEVLTRLAYATYTERLVQARVAAAQAKTLIVIPMGLMIVPVLLLIGAPLAASLAGIFGQ